MVLILFSMLWSSVSAQTTKINSENITNYSNPIENDIYFNGADGPYILNDTLFRVSRQNQFVKEINFKKDSLLVEVDNTDKDFFYFNLNEANQIPKSDYLASNKMLVISDIEGNYNAFASFLFSNKVIDQNHNWIFNISKLILVGDFVDRGKNVTQVLWLIYKLEQQAIACGGQVHFILGNHELLNFQGKHRYNRLKYINVAQEISGSKDKTEAIRYMYSETSIIGKWLATKNVIEKIGDYIFVHAGLSEELLDYKLPLNVINTKARSQFQETDFNDDKTIRFLYGSQGPLWYRGLVLNTEQYPSIKQKHLDEILDYYKAKKVVIGHTTVNNISKTYEGKVIRVDVLHGTTKFSGRTKGLLIEDGIEYIVDDLGNKIPL
tara:strand:+ start:83 stop:1219 length:1137 start_codon:yes stop_codon:yes gene_type:complete